MVPWRSISPPMEQKVYDWILRGGRVIDPANHIDRLADVAIAGGKIAAVGEIAAPGTREFDARGLVVCPGLVDIHIHGYHLATPLGIDVDHYCLGRGVTTAVDAGSAGACTVAGFRAFAVNRFRTRLLGFLHISSIGLAAAGLGGSSAPGECDSLKTVDADDCIRAIEANRDILVGVKIRLSDTCADDGRNEAEAYERALRAAETTGLPLMVHHSFSFVDLPDCPGRMKAGDIYTHCFHGFPSTILEPESRRIHPAVAAARERGVLFDIGHGQGSFTWTVAEAAAAQGFWPDTISTDLHSGTCEGPCYDMPTAMTRMLRVGMPLPELIRASTLRPAQAVGIAHEAGTLDVGRAADIAVLRIEDAGFELDDCQGQMRRLEKRIRAAAVWRAGEQYPLTEPRRFADPEVTESQRQWWPRLLVRDPELTYL